MSREVGGLNQRYQTSHVIVTSTLLSTSIAWVRDQSYDLKRDTVSIDLVEAMFEIAFANTDHYLVKQIIDRFLPNHFSIYFDL